MKLIERIGNLRVYRDPENAIDSLLFDEPIIKLEVFNGCDVVACETYFSTDEAECVRSIMRNLFDTWTLPEIYAGLWDLREEYGGDLIYGHIISDKRLDYFKRIDSTHWFRHFGHRPAMNREEYQNRRQRQ